MRPGRRLLPCIVVLAGLQSTKAQTIEPPTIRISVRLVQVDAVVTGSDGRPVTGLTAGDFEVLQDGRTQDIVHCSYVQADSGKREDTSQQERLRPEQVRRTIALVADDLSLSFTSVGWVREALRRFVDEQMQPGDLVAILRTSGAMGALQQFTSDKRQLHAAISQLHWKMRRGFPIEFPTELSEEFTPAGISEETETPPQSFGTIGALNYIVRGLKDVPGRKLIILFSDGLSLGERDTLARELRQRFSDMAGRASVVVYTIYAAGVQAPLIDPYMYDPLRAPMLSDSLPAMRNLAAISEQTGGRHLAYNDLSSEVSTILNQEAGYYLIGYRPDESTFRNPNRFHTLEVRVRRAGLTVRSRRGFYGVAEEDLPAMPDDPKRQLANVLISPFVSNTIAVRMEPRVSYSPKIGPYVSCRLYLDAKPLSFSQDAEGWMNGAVEVLLATFGANGERVDVRAHTFYVRTRGRTYQHILENGLTYIITLPVKKPGPYQVRAAVRDVKSRKVGSAFEFVQIPSASRNRNANHKRLPPG